MYLKIFLFILLEETLKGIHCLIPELIYSFKKDKIKAFHHFNFYKLRKNFQFGLIRLSQEAGGLKKPEDKYMTHCPECDHKMIVKK